MKGGSYDCQSNKIMWNWRESDTLKERMRRRSKPDGSIISLELNVLVFSTMITKEVQQVKGGWKEGRRRERKMNN